MWTIDFAQTGWTLADFLRRVDGGEPFWNWCEALRSGEGIGQKARLIEAVRIRLQTYSYRLTGSLVPSNEVERVDVPTEHWATLEGRFERSEAETSSGLQAGKYYYLRVFPPLTGDWAAEQLAGKSIIECFDEFVRNDAEFLALARKSCGEEETSLHAHLYSFTRGPFRDENAPIWPVLQRPGEALEWTVDPHDRESWFFLLHEPGSFSAWIKANVVFQDRLNALFSQLAVGNLVAEGFVPGRGREEVSRALWQSGYNVSVDFRTGDLIESSDEVNWTVLYRGLILKLPDSGLMAQTGRSRSRVPMAVPVAKLVERMNEIFSRSWLRKSDVFAELKKDFPNLSRREFDRRWAEYAPADWTARGRRSNT
jgi:hypothetical protein